MDWSLRLESTLYAGSSGSRILEYGGRVGFAKNCSIFYAKLMHDCAKFSLVLGCMPASFHLNLPLCATVHGYGYIVQCKLLVINVKMLALMQPVVTK